MASIELFEKFLIIPNGELTDRTIYRNQTLK